MFGVYMCLFCVCVVLCLGRGLATSWSIVQGVLPIVNRSGDWNAARAHKGCRAFKNYIVEETITFCNYTRRRYEWRKVRERPAKRISEKWWPCRTNKNAAKCGALHQQEEENICVSRNICWVRYYRSILLVCEDNGYKLKVFAWIYRLQRRKKKRIKWQ
jgi:hypothetical protein